MLTESEAKTKWCPAYRESSDGANRYAIYERQADGEYGHTPNTIAERCRCIASQCMWWQWEYRDEIVVPEGAPIPDGYVDFALIVRHYGGEKTNFRACRLGRSEDGKPVPMRGYCGAVSKP